MSFLSASSSGRENSESFENSSSLNPVLHTLHNSLLPKDLFFLLGYVEERLWWPIQSPNIGTVSLQICSTNDV